MDWLDGTLIVAGVVLLLALIKSSSFNITEYLKLRDRRRERRFMERCPHGAIHVTNDPFEIYVESWFFSPPGTMLYLCKRCSMAVHGEQAKFAQEQLSLRAIQAAKEAGISTEGWTIKEMP